MQWWRRGISAGMAYGSLAVLPLYCMVAQGAPNAKLADNQLLIQPNTCVSLHQGQTCFASLTLRWHTAEKNNYCLYSSAQIEPIQCWVNSQQGQVTQSFSSAHSQRFYLQADGSDTHLAESEVQVSWVYQKQQKSRLSWRLF